MNRTTVANAIRVVSFIGWLAVLWQAIRWIQGDIGNPAAPIFDMFTQSPRDSIAGTIDAVMRELFGILCWMGLALCVAQAGVMLSRVVEVGWRQYRLEQHEARYKRSNSEVYPTDRPEDTDQSKHQPPGTGRKEDQCMSDHAPEILSFMNDRPAPCGCRAEYSRSHHLDRSGAGEYSDNIRVTLCPRHSDIERYLYLSPPDIERYLHLIPRPQIALVPVVRDEFGWWIHPQYPDLPEGSSREEVNAAFAALGLESRIVAMEDDPETEALFDRLLDDATALCDWEPSRPDGLGWVEFAIFDTEDAGPICVWVRPVPPEAPAS
ncbi:hypothetical protein [Rhizobium sp. LCM 4573]|uniref:hypothetical protein n=1 Tax=Rhizobium sp. LCM 4573 TaxID=1848291 RepID=UPI0009F73D7E|nr:hypothetical protein [Rhizobium sp. LCM 4573]